MLPIQGNRFPQKKFKEFWRKVVKPSRLQWLYVCRFYFA